MKSEKLKGIFFVLLGAASFALMSVFVRLAGDIPTFEKAFFRNSVSLAISGYAMLRSRIPFRVPKECRKFVIFRAVFGTIALLCNFYAISTISLSDANMMSKLSPFFAIVFSACILKENVKKTQLLLVLGAFAGSLFIIKPSISNIVLIPTLIAGLGGICVGFTQTCVRACTTRGVPKNLIVFVFSVFSSVVILPFAFTDFVMPTALQLFYLIMCGVCSAGGQYAITFAYSHAPAREISVYDYSQVIFSAILGFFIFDQKPDIYSLIGYIIIISLAVINSRIESRSVENGIEATAGK